jgi:hypothetical protein
MNEQELAKGFNAGYIIQKHRPEIADSLTEAVRENKDEFFQGLVAGSEQYSKERTQSKTISKLRDTVRQLPRSTQKGKDSPNKGFDLDR